MLTFSNTPARSGLRPTRVRMRIPCESARARPKFDFETLDDMKRTQAEFQERQKGSVTANGLPSVVRLMTRCRLALRLPVTNPVHSRFDYFRVADHPDRTRSFGFSERLLFRVFAAAAIRATEWSIAVVVSFESLGL